MLEVTPRRPVPLLDGGEERDANNSAASEELHLKDFWAILVKRRRLAAIVFLVVLAIGSYCTMTATRLYVAVATLKIEPQNPSVSGLTEMFQSSTGGPGAYDYYQTQFALLESRTLAARVISELRLESNAQFVNARIVSADAIGRVRSTILGYVGSTAEYLANLVFGSPVSEPRNRSKTAGPPNAAASNAAPSNPLATVPPRLVSQYLRLVKVDPVRKTRLVEVIASTPDRALAKILANAHAEAFIRMNLDNRFNLTTEAREFLGKKLSELKAKVERAEDNLNRFLKSHGVWSMEKGENIIVERLIEINKQLTRARADRIDAESLQTMVGRSNHQEVAEVLKQGLVPQLRANVATLEGEKQRLLTLVTPDHPRIQDLTKQIAEARSALNAEIANAVRLIKSNYAAARAREEALEAEARAQQQQALNLKDLTVEYSVLKEDVTVNRTLYESVLKRLYETQVSNDLAVSNIQLVQEAETPLGPSAPNIPMNLMMTIALGLFLGVGSAFAREYMDSTINTPDRVWRAVSTGTLGVVPDLRLLSRHGYQLTDRITPLLERIKRRQLLGPNGHSKDLISVRNPLSVVTESYRKIRTSVLFSQAEKPPKIVLLTSPSPGEGKTVTTLNLGIALAQNGDRVLVVDADLRNGCCHNRLGIKTSKGLSNVITGQMVVEEAIQPTSVPGLSILPRGTCPPNPGDLLGSIKMRDILRTVQYSFEFILIDSPPVVAVSDAAVLSVLCDGVILVIHARRTTTTAARHAMTQLNAVRAPVLGVVLNGVDLRNPDYAYYRQYYGTSYFSAGEFRNGGAKRSAPPIEANARPYFGESEGDAVTEPVFARICLRLIEAAGPIAPLLFRDQITRLGQSVEQLPKDRLYELLERFCDDNVSESMRHDFLSSVQHELWSSTQLDV